VVWVRHETPEDRSSPRPTKAGGVFYERAFTMQPILDVRGIPQPTDIILHLDAPNFRPGSQKKKLSIPAGADSAPCTFLIKPSLPGELVANLELLNADEKVIASRSIRTRALHLTDDDVRSGFFMSFSVLKRIYEDLAEFEDHSAIEAAR
jgi:hypothetical protein